MDTQYLSSKSFFIRQRKLLASKYPESKQTTNKWINKQELHSHPHMP